MDSWATDFWATGGFCSIFIPKFFAWSAFAERRAPRFKVAGFWTRACAMMAVVGEIILLIRLPFDDWLFRFELVALSGSPVDNIENLFFEWIVSIPLIYTFG